MKWWPSWISDRQINHNLGSSSHIEFPNGTKIILNVEDHQIITFATLGSIGPVVCEKKYIKMWKDLVYRRLQNDDNTAYGPLEYGSLEVILFNTTVHMRKLKLDIMAL